MLICIQFKIILEVQKNMARIAGVDLPKEKRVEIVKINRCSNVETTFKHLLKIG